MASPKVREFCRKFHEALEAEHWGSIEPEVFLNIAEGVVRGSPDGFHANKMDEDDMADSVESMTEILEKILP